jgi:hypothetical protein
MYGNFPPTNTVCTPYIPINVWSWPTLVIYGVCVCARFWPTLVIYGVCVVCVCVCVQFWPTLVINGVCVHGSGQPWVQAISNMTGRTKIACNDQIHEEGNNHFQKNTLTSAKA